MLIIYQRWKAQNRSIASNRHVQTLFISYASILMHNRTESSTKRQTKHALYK